MNRQFVSPLDLAPKLKRPLSLRNPLDYVHLLYWVFFFPQAIRWYVNQFCQAENEISSGFQGALKRLRNDPTQRSLMLQAFFALLLATICIVGLLKIIGVPMNWFGTAVGIFIGVALGTGMSISINLAFSIGTGVAFGMGFGVATGVDSSVATGFGQVAVLAMISGMAIGMAMGTVPGGGRGINTSVAGGVVVSVAISTSFGMLFGLMKIVKEDVTQTVINIVVMGLGAGVVGGMTGGITTLRVLDWLTCSLFVLIRPDWISPNRSIWLPLPRLSRQIETWLEHDWDVGIHNVNQLLAYTHQFIPAVIAVNAALSHLPADEILPAVARITNEPFDWKLVHFGSANLANRLRYEFIEGFNLIPTRWRKRWRTRIDTSLRLDTPSHAACAGFSYWHEGDARKALQAFTVVHNLRHGYELYEIARAIVAGQQAYSLQDIANWETSTTWLTALPDPELRHGTLAALRTLRAIASEARVAQHSISPLNRSTAIGRANAKLTTLLETISTKCPYPEWPLIMKMAQIWRDVISQAGGTIGEEILRQPVLNPYEGYSGLPVTGTSFKGRSDILNQIETRWATSDLLPPLILFGHRRMGKSSLLRNLSRSMNTNTLSAYLNMENTAWVDNTGDLLFDFAKAIYDTVSRVGLGVEPTPKVSDFTDLGTGRHTLNILLQRLDSVMANKHMIVAVDEYEKIEDGIVQGRIDAGFPHYIRAIIQDHRWLAFIFAGLHTLDEMGHDYQSAFYGQAEHIKVSYLNYDDAIRLIAVPHPDFALEYAPELREELYRLTYGQPYLIQRLCWDMVNRWNERFLKQGETTSRLLTLEDLDPALTPDLFNAAEYYFDGVWSNITDDERALLRLIAGHENGIRDIDELVSTTHMDDMRIHATINLLDRHDVIIPEPCGFRIASELMRRWIVQHYPAIN